MIEGENFFQSLFLFRSQYWLTNKRLSVVVVKGEASICTWLHTMFITIECTYYITAIFGSFWFQKRELESCATQTKGKRLNYSVSMASNFYFHRPLPKRINPIHSFTFQSSTTIETDSSLLLFMHLFYFIFILLLSTLNEKKTWLNCFFNYNSSGWSQCILKSPFIFLI